jgi:hypothetical protein
MLDHSRTCEHIQRSERRWNTDLRKQILPCWISRPGALQTVVFLLKCRKILQLIGVFCYTFVSIYLPKWCTTGTIKRTEIVATTNRQKCASRKLLICSKESRVAYRTETRWNREESNLNRPSEYMFFVYSLGRFCFVRETPGKEISTIRLNGFAWWAANVSLNSTNFFSLTEQIPH